MTKISAFSKTRFISSMTEGGARSPPVEAWRILGNVGGSADDAARRWRNRLPSKLGPA
jgi:hypothetical protein